LQRELSSAPPPSTDAATDAFPDISACAPELRSVLEDVASGTSEYSAPAALALIDAGYSAPRAAGATSEAVQAREAVGRRAGARRRASFLHGDAAVRRGALGAALEGAADADAADIAALAEAARLDPDPEARRLAIRALGRVGNGASVQALDDVYAAALPEDRREIVLAWSLPASFVAGGGTELEALARAGASPVELDLAPDAAGILRADWAPLLDRLCDERLSRERRASEFHATLLETAVRQVEYLSTVHAFDAVGLVGGVFQNRLLCEGICERLARRGTPVHLPLRLPFGDGGLSYGQLIESVALQLPS